MNFITENWFVLVALAAVAAGGGYTVMVDEALDKMKTMLESNTAMQELVSGEAGESGE